MDQLAPGSVCKSICICIFNTIIIVVAAFSIITMLPCDVFPTDTVSNVLSLAIAGMLGIGTLTKLCKLKTGHEKNIFQHHLELKNIFMATLILAFLAALLSSSLFVWSFFLTKSEVSIYNKLYFAFITIFLISILLPPYTMTTYDYKRSPQNALNTLAFCSDRYLLTLYIATYIQINCLEARETLELYDQRLNCTNSSSLKKFFKPFYYTLFEDDTGTRSSHDPLLQLYDIFKSAAYAITVEVLALLFFCHMEQKHLEKRHPHVNNCTNNEERMVHEQQDQPSTSGQINSVTHYGETSLQGPDYHSNESVNDGVHACADDPLISQRNDNQNQRQTTNHFTNTTIFCDVLTFGIGISSVVLTVSSLIGVHIVGQIGRYANQNQDVLLCKIFFFGSMIIYVAILFCITKPWQVAEFASVSSILDVQLLRWTMYGLLLLESLIRIGGAWGPSTPVSHSPLNYFHFIGNVTQVWTQYSFLYSFLAVEKQLKLLFNEPAQQKIWKCKMRFFVIPLFIANAFFWMYDLWEWKTVAMLAPPAGSVQQSPGAVWAVTEAILFPIEIFYRFHSAFLCFMLCNVPMPEWYRQLRNRNYVVMAAQ